MLRYAPGLDPGRKPRSPLEALADLSCPLLGLYGEDDHLIPVADVHELDECRRKSGRPGFQGSGRALGFR